MATNAAFAFDPENIRSPGQPPPAPIFPLDIFPDDLAKSIEDLHEQSNLPLAHLAASKLFAVAAAIGNSYHYQAIKGYTGAPILWMCLVGDPGSGKSHAVTRCLKPITKFDDLRYADYENKLKLYEDAKRLKADPMPDYPNAQQLIYNDFTLETLYPAHNYNKKGLAVHSDEIVSWLHNMNRYNKGSDIGHWLSLWDGNTTAYNRKSSRAYRLKSPCISIIGTTQTDMLSKVFSNEMMTNGFFERFIFVLSDDPKQRGKDIDIDDKWTALIQKLLEKEFQEPKLLLFDAEANKLREEFVDRNNERINLTHNGKKKSTLAKWETYFYRFCLIIQVINDCHEGNEPIWISAKAVKSAEKLHVYLFPQSENALNTITAPGGLDSWKLKLYDALPADFETKKAIDTGKLLNVSQRSVKRFLSDVNFFEDAGHGKYSKK